MLCPYARLGALATVALAVAAAPTPEDEGAGAPATATLRDGFEDPRPAWRREETDATINLLAHDRSDRAAHEGRLSERFHFEAGPGSALYFSYPLPKVTV